MAEPEANQSRDSDLDAHHGLSWSDRLQFGVLRYALDPFDVDGRKNRYIDSVHRVGLRQGLGARRFHRALDFGCGCGRLLDELTACTDEVYGIDRTEPALDFARRAGTVPHSNLVLWCDGPIPYSDRFFDLVISVYVMLTPEILDASLSELRRVCSDDALIILVEQVNAARGLGLERYTTALQQSGFAVEFASPIRRAPWSKYIRMATLARWPAGILRLLAKAEARSMRGQFPDVTGQLYCDYLITARPVLTKAGTDRV